MNPLREHREFYRQFRERFETTGAIAPSSRFLARALTRPLRQRSVPRRVLEVGPGTGAVTRAIVRSLGPDDQFDLVEINPEFADLLRQRFANDPNFQHVADRTTVHEVALQNFTADATYDVVISGLPFNNFPSALVEELIDACLHHVSDQGSLSFFEYMFVRSIRRRTSAEDARRRLAEIEAILQNRFSQYRSRTDWVFANLPPAWVQHLVKSDSRVPRATSPIPLATTHKQG